MGNCWCILGLICLAGIYPNYIKCRRCIKGSGIAMGTLLGVAGLGG